MSITATVINDTIKLPEGVHLPDGTTVTVEEAKASAAQATPRKTFAERYAKYIGCMSTGLGDLAENHDHYLYGTPKQQP